MKPEDIIPHGLYCYTRTGFTKVGQTKPCPFYSYYNTTYNTQDCYCLLLGICGDESTLLSDHCKECGINED
jgi:hypothetical protein